MKYPAYENYVPSKSVWLDLLPSHWQQLRIKHVIDRMESGVSVNSDAIPASNEAIGVLKTSCVYGDQFSPQENKQVLEEETERVTCPVKADRLIISRMNTPELVGSCGYVSRDFPNLYLPDRLWQTVFNKSRGCVPKFAWYFLTARPAKSAISSLAAGTSGSMQNIAQDAFFGIDFPLPPLAEQETIARFLDAKTAQIDALLAQKRQLIAKLKEKRQALIARTVTRGLPPEAAKAAGLEPQPAMKDSGVDWLGEVPGHWEIKRLKHIANRAEVKVEADEHNPLPYIGLEQVGPWTGRLIKLDDDLVPTGVSNRFATGDTLFGKLRPYLAKACNVDFDGLCSSELLVLRGNAYDRKFLLYQLLSHGFINLVDSSTYGSKMPRANWDFIGSCELPLPPLPEQAAIAAYLDAQSAQIDTLLTKTDAAITRLAEYRLALITSAVTGKIDVRGWAQQHKAGGKAFGAPNNTIKTEAAQAGLAA